jgi:cytochrome c peroxidase
MVRHHLDPITSIQTYDPAQAVLPAREDLDAVDRISHADSERRAELTQACELDPVELTDEEFSDLVAFLHALTDPASVDLRTDVPQRVPSGLPVFD